ncbi:MAG: hypothetical protein JNM58_19605 [Xanthomonadaceae bacterium]|nr:hypothetical protein [Xanthomonadaceae bacterium]
MSIPSTHLRGRKLVSVRRQDIDDYGVQGFLVGLSEALLALEHVYDFQVDGILVLRRSDITEVKCTATDAFQESLMKREGIVPGSQAPSPLALETWRALIEQLAGSHPFLALEQELGPEPQLSIGRVVSVEAQHVEFQCFSGTGKWQSKPDRIKYAHLTSAQANTRYLRFYQRHLLPEAC